MSDSGRLRSLGAALKARRVELDPAYKNRALFAQHTGLNYRLIGDIEQARRDVYRGTTMQAIERAYRLKPGSIQRHLDHGQPLSPDAPEITRPETALTAEELADPVVRTILNVPDDPRRPLRPEERVAKAKEAHHLIASGQADLTAEEASDPHAQLILGITGADMSLLIPKAQEAYRLKQEQQQRSGRRSSA